jgi:hypothetical protein
MHHYIYYSYEEWGRGYIGARTCKCLPEEDIKYFGSFKDKTFKPTQKIVLQTFKTRKEALCAEVVLHGFYKVNINPHFANRAKQTSTGFNRQGTITSVETRKKLSKKLLGRAFSQEHRERKSKAQIGRKHSKETKEKISKALRNRDNLRRVWCNDGQTERLTDKCPKLWARGRLSCSEETKEKMSSSRAGNKWWNNGSLSKFCKEKPGIDWVEGNIIFSGKKWWNNGIEQKRCKNSPDAGWVPGRINAIAG